MAGENSGEAFLFKRGLGGLFDEIRQSILQNKLLISPKKTTSKTGADNLGSTGNLDLAGKMNKALQASLKSLGWGPKTAPGALGIAAKIDWYKSIQSGISYGPREIGLGLEIQFGNNYQFDADLKRLHEGILDNLIVAGISIVASDELAKYKSDRGAYFTQEKQKLDRYLKILSASGVAVIPHYILIGVEHDGFVDDTEGKFFLQSPIFDEKAGVQIPPVRMEDFSTITSKP